MLKTLFISMWNTDNNLLNVKRFGLVTLFCPECNLVFGNSKLFRQGSSGPHIDLGQSGLTIILLFKDNLKLQHVTIGKIILLYKLDSLGIEVLVLQYHHQTFLLGEKIN